MIKLTEHAIIQIESRVVDGQHLTSASETLRVVQEYERALSKAGGRASGYEVRVVIKTLNGVKVCPDGSTGDVVVACVDTRNKSVKTVMLKKRQQLTRDKWERGLPFLGSIK